MKRLQECTQLEKKDQFAIFLLLSWAHWVIWFKSPLHLALGEKRYHFPTFQGHQYSFAENKDELSDAVVLALTTDERLFEMDSKAIFVGLSVFFFVQNTSGTVGKSCPSYFSLLFLRVDANDVWNTQKSVCVWLSSRLFHLINNDM